MVNSINSGHCYIHLPAPHNLHQQLLTFLSLPLPFLKDKTCPGPYSGLTGMKICLPEAGTSQHLKEEGRGLLRMLGIHWGRAEEGKKPALPPPFSCWGRVSHPAKQGTWILRAAYQVSLEPMSLAVSAYYPAHPSALLHALPAPGPACAN